MVSCIGRGSGLAQVLAVACLFLAACSSGHSSLSADVQSVGFDGTFEFLVERRTGPEQCFMADCPAIARYYLSDDDTGRACEALDTFLRGTDVAVDQTLGDERCRFLGAVGDVRMDVRVTGPITEIPPDDQTLKPFQVTDAHGSVVVVRASRG